MRDFSQYGEATWIRSYFSNPKHKFFVDVGAFGMSLSNTWSLATEGGWKGIAIEANPDRIAALRKDFKGTDVKVVSAAVGAKWGVTRLNLHSIPEHDSLKEHWYQETKTPDSIVVVVVPLAVVMKACDVPVDFDFLSIDTEGMDEEIMEAFFAEKMYYPKLVVTEAMSYQDADGFFTKRGYRLVHTTGSGVYTNRFYERCFE